LKRDGTVWAWGDNYYGQIGDGTTTDRTSPVQVPGLTGVVSIAAGLGNSSATTSDGSVWTWGSNYFGQVGDGSLTQRNSPVPVSFDTTPPATTASPAGGVYATAQTVSLTANEAATVYYTLDGSTPTTSSAVYTAPLAISAGATLKYFAVDAAGNKEIVKSQSYSIGTAVPPTAGFSAAATGGETPFTATFSDTSTGDPTSWLWDFGDGSTSTLQNPQHIYDTAGSYSVSLSVTNGAGSNTVTKSGYVNVSDPVVTSLQSAYDVAVDGGDIRLRTGNLFEDLLLQRDIKVNICGGYDAPYLSVIGATTIHGKLTISKGTISVGNIILK
jgi:PKD repeat protein